MLVNIDVDDLNTEDIIEILEDRGFQVIGHHELGYLSKYLKLGQKERVCELLDDMFLMTVAPSFSEVFLDEE